MSQICPTVAIKADNDDGYRIINESDLKEGDVVIGGESKPKTPEAPKPKVKSKSSNKSDK